MNNLSVNLWKTPWDQVFASPQFRFVTRPAHFIKIICNFIFLKNIVLREILWSWVFHIAASNFTLLGFVVATTLLALACNCSRYYSLFTTSLSLSLHFSFVYHHFKLSLTLLLSYSIFSFHFISCQFFFNLLFLFC